MFRTRDFALLFSMIAFLVVAIGGTLLLRYFDGAQSQTADDLVFVDTSTATYTAEISATDTLARDERLDAMKQKVAVQGESIRAPEPVSVAETEEVTATTEETVSEEEQDPATPELFVEQRCGNYRVFAGFWDATQIEMEVTAMTREWYVPVEKQFFTSSTSSGLTEPFIDKETRLIVARNPGVSGEYCIASDVIGVATDGSLIRNNEVGLYGVFGGGTLIGYALDGHPLYGDGDIETDVCGGATVSGRYGYYLNSESTVIIGCFVAQPSSSLYP